ncbi:hypothetical protein [Methylocaldum sp.]|uniref:COG4648 family protein n=1 Tax=Methylocaldum sp. TaxID=1969727 RepID=UPI002D65D0B6|nr:hypothetical protein [Methylocaldum sp.]HYE37211.1 hypothetical protein [Methylocaldum sp.]
MGIRQAFTLCLAALFPVLSYAAIRLDIPPVWLGLVDFLLLTAILIAARLSRGGRAKAISRLWPIAAGLGLCLAVFYLRPDALIYFSPIGIGLILASLFLTTLAPGQEPLITRLARLERGVLPDDLRIYTRNLTCAWAIFFCLLILESVLLALFAPVKTFLLFTNTLNYLFVAAFFVTEYIYRRIRYRHHSHPSIIHLIAIIARSGVIAATKK